MTLLPDTLAQLAQAGASLRVDARQFSPVQLQRLATEAAAGGGRLTIANAQALTPDNARALATILGARIEFDA